MPGVYGDFLDAFPELKRKLSLWETDPTILTTIQCLVWDHAGLGIARTRLGTEKDSTGDISAHYSLYIDSVYKDKVKVGMYFYHPDSEELCRIVKDQGYDYAAGYFIFLAERVMGSGPDKTDPLIVKGARIA